MKAGGTKVEKDFSFKNENAERKAISDNISNSLKNSKLLIGLNRETNGTDVFHLFVALCLANRELIQNELKLQGIQTDVHYPRAIHQQECFKTPDYNYLKNSSYPVSEYFANSVISLPNFPWMNSERLGHLTESLAKLEV